MAFRKRTNLGDIFYRVLHCADGRLGRRLVRSAAGPRPLPDGWVARVDTPARAIHLQQVNDSLQRGRAFGSTSWTTRTTTALACMASCDCQDFERIFRIEGFGWLSRTGKK